MKRRKVMSVLLLLIAVVTLGIGYALTTKNLKLEGTVTAKANDDDFVVKFVASENKTDPSNNTVVTDISYTDLVATFKATLDSEHKTAEAVYTIKNASPELKADLKKTAETISGDTDYFTTNVTFTDTVLDAGAETTLTVKVELNKVPIADKSITIEIPLTADAVEA